MSYVTICQTIIRVQPLSRSILLQQNESVKDSMFVCLVMTLVTLTHLLVGCQITEMLRVRCMFVWLLACYTVVLKPASVCEHIITNESHVWRETKPKRFCCAVVYNCWPTINMQYVTSFGNLRFGNMLLHVCVGIC